MNVQPVISFDWLTHADIAIVLGGCLVLMAISLYVDCTARRKLRNKYRHSVLDNNRVIHRW